MAARSPLTPPPPAQHVGQFILNTDGSFTYTHNGTETPTTDTFTYRASDGTAQSGLATVTITIKGMNDGPVAVNDSYTTDEDTALTIVVPGVLVNDSDVDMDSLTAILVGVAAVAAAPLAGAARLRRMDIPSDLRVVE